MMRISISSLPFNMKHEIRCWSLKTFAVVLPNDSCHYVKSVGIRSYSGPHFAAFGLNTERYSIMMECSEILKIIKTGIFCTIPARSHWIGPLD